MARREMKAGGRRSTTKIPLETSLVARRYFLDDVPKNQIALEFGISRFKVARLLEEAKALGIVRVSVDSPADVDIELGEHLRERFGIRLAIVAAPTPEFPGASEGMMATLAADYLMNTLGPDDVLGISWGATVARVIDEIDSLPPVDVVQMVGGVRSSDLDSNGSELVRRLTEVGQGRAYPLMAPLIVDSLATATALTKDAAIADVIERFKRLSFALVGVGSWEPAQSSLLRELAASDRREARENGAVADLCGIILDDTGAAVITGAKERTLSIGWDDLHAVSTVVAVAGGSDKGRAVAGALRSGLIDVVVTDSACAELILATTS
jgi:DNA-binding transcriptional regulator LsrR (DeoR family)